MDTTLKDTELVTCENEELFSGKLVSRVVRVATRFML